MSIVNGILRPLFDGILLPFRDFHPLVGLFVLSIPVSAGMLWVFKKTSNQDRLAQIKDRIQSGLFEVRLFNHDLRAIFRAQGEILMANLKYLGNALIPLLWMIVPFVFLMSQLQIHYGFQGFDPGDTTVVKVQLDDDWSGRVPGEAGRPDLRLEIPDGLSLDSSPVWIPSLNEMAWRVSVDEPGNFELVVRAGDEEVTKSLVATDQIVRRSAARIAPSFFDEIIYSGEAVIPQESAIQAIHVAYPENGAMFLDLSVWVWIFVGLTIVVAFAIRKPMGVTI